MGKGKPSDDYLKLLTFVESLSEGAQLMWQEIEDSTKVKMDNAGKSKFRTAVWKKHRHYVVLTGIGVIMDSVENFTSIDDSRVRRIRSSVSKGRRTFDDHAARYIERANPEAAKELRMRQAISAAILASTEKSLIYRPPEKHLVIQTSEHLDVKI